MKEKEFAGNNAALLTFVAVALWLMLFYSDIFR
jgi:hypothetical protein